MRVLYLDIDTLRPDHLSCYGYRRPTSPNLDQLAARSIRFDNCYASDAPCLPSRASCWTGRLGIHTGLINHGGECADPQPEGAGRSFRHARARDTLAHAIKYAGLHPVSISPFAERHTAWWFYSGFKEMYNPGLGGMERADQVVPLALDWLDRNQDRDDWFLHVNVWDPHTFFRTPTEHGDPFAGQPAPDWMTDERITHHWHSYGPHSAQEVSGYSPVDRSRDFPRDLGQIRDRAAFNRWIDGYDTGIWYADLWIGKILEKLEQQGKLHDTAIIVTSDHGENHGELGVYGDHQTADHITCRVPYLLYWPGLTDGGRVDRALHYQSDLSATLLQLLNIKVPADWDGRGFAEAVQTGREEGRGDLVIANNAWSCQRGVRWDDWMFIRTYHTGYKPFPEYMLFDLAQDPHETTNLARQKPELVAEGTRRLEAWQAEMMRTADRPIDPMWIVMREGGPLHANDRSGETRKYLARLRETGRAGYADWLEKNSGRPIPAGAPWAASLEPGQQFLRAPCQP